MSRGPEVQRHLPAERVSFLRVQSWTVTLESAGKLTGTSTAPGFIVVWSLPWHPLPPWNRCPGFA